MKNPLGVSPSKGYQGTTRGKEKNSYDLGGNWTHDLRIRSIKMKSSTDLVVCRSKTLSKCWISSVFRFQCFNFYLLIPLRDDFANGCRFRVGEIYSAFFICWRVHWPCLSHSVYELITCVQLANENTGNLIHYISTKIYSKQSCQIKMVRH